MTDSPEYSQERAALYDNRLAEADGRDLDFYVDLARETDGSVLEMACGTGRIYLELLRAGIEADGFDRSKAMLTVLRENAAAAGLDPSVWQADMTDFAVDRAYDLVICPFNAFQHLHALADQEAALESVYDALAPGGRFVMDVFVPGFEFVCETFGEWQTETVQVDGTAHEFRSRSRIVDEVRQIFAVENEAYDSAGDRTFAFEHRLKFLPAREVELLVRDSPFDDWHVTGDFTDESLANGHTTQVWTLAKSQES